MSAGSPVELPALPITESFVLSLNLRSVIELSITSAESSNVAESNERSIVGESFATKTPPTKSLTKILYVLPPDPDPLAIGS